MYIYSWFNGSVCANNHLRKYDHDVKAAGLNFIYCSQQLYSQSIVETHLRFSACHWE